MLFNDNCQMELPIPRKSKAPQMASSLCPSGRQTIRFCAAPGQVPRGESPGFMYELLYPHKSDKQVYVVMRKWKHQEIEVLCPRLQTSKGRAGMFLC